MKTNIILKLDTAILREIRILAAEEGSSISVLLAAKLEEIVRERKRIREHLETARAKAGKQRFLRHAGTITGGPPDISSRKGFSRFMRGIADTGFILAFARRNDQ
jgi:hypothetical protein